MMFNWKMLLLSLLTFFSLLVSLKGLYTILQQEENAYEEVRREAEEYAEESVKLIEGYFTRIEKVAENLAVDLSGTRFSGGRISIETRLRELAFVNPEIISVGVAFRPNMFTPEPNTRLYAPRSQRQNNKYKMVDISNFSDYTLAAPENDWFGKSIVKGASSWWKQPFFDIVSNIHVVQFTVPFFGASDLINPRGVVYIQYSLEELSRLLSAVKYGESGYYFILSDEGKILSHPVKAFVNKNTPLEKIVKEFSFEEVEQGWQNNFFEDVDIISGEKSYIKFHKAPSTGWFIAILQHRDEIEGKLPDYFHNRIKTISSFIWFLLFLSSLFFTGKLGSSHRWLWIGSCWASILFLSGIALIWHTSLISSQNDTDSAGKEESDVIHNRASLNSFRKKYVMASLSDGNSLPIFIPTGIYVQSLEFIDKNNLQITGYVWQKYPRHFQYKKGVIFPEAVGTQMSDDPTYVRRDDGYESLGWYFEVVLRQDFNISRFPLDHTKVNIRLWHKEFDKNIILLPDIDSYDSTSPFALAGMGKKIVIPGWNFEQSYFSFEPNSYNTNFGISDYEGQKEFPELHFNIMMRREFMGPFISYVVPIFVVAVILFFCVMSVTNRPDKVAIVGFSGSTAVEIVAALFFAVLLSHIDLRSTLPVSGFFYLETFYFSMYCMLLMVAVNSMLVAWEADISFIRHMDNIWFKVLYWPLLLFTLFAFTVYSFY